MLMKLWGQRLWVGKKYLEIRISHFYYMIPFHCKIPKENSHFLIGKCKFKVTKIYVQKRPPEAAWLFKIKAPLNMFERNSQAIWKWSRKSLSWGKENCQAASRDLCKLLVKNSWVSHVKRGQNVNCTATVAILKSRGGGQLILFNCTTLVHYIVWEQKPLYESHYLCDINTGKSLTYNLNGAQNFRC